MEIYLDCLPCTLRQALEASRMATDDKEIQDKIMFRAMEILADYKNFGSSPEMGRAVHLMVKEFTGEDDPYEKIKQRDIKAALKVYPLLERFLGEKQDKLYWALKTAATGNVIDSAVNNNVSMEDCVEKELGREFSVCDIEVLREKLKTAKTLLIIGDNAGETVFDRVLAAYLSNLDITYAVKSGPIINDATESDAYASRLNDFCKIISTGCNVPGTVLPECSAEFLEVFNNADIVISKGQGNFETISGSPRDVFYLLKAKCSMISHMFGVNINDYVFKYIEGRT